jgi:hypothetical protein
MVYVYKITARENIIGIDYTWIPIERNLVVGDLYRYKLQLSFDPSRYVIFKIVNNVGQWYKMIKKLSTLYWLPIFI